MEEKIKEPEINPRKKLTAFRIEDDLREIANELILIRAVKTRKKIETFSDLLRNLIKEEWKRNKEYLKGINESD